MKVTKHVGYLKGGYKGVWTPPPLWKIHMWNSDIKIVGIVKIKIQWKKLTCTLPKLEFDKEKDLSIVNKMVCCFGTIPKKN